MAERPIPRSKAFCLNDPTDRFICLEIFTTGVLAFECCFNSLTSAVVYGLRAGLFFFPLAKWSS